MTSAEVGFTSMDEIPPKRRTAVSLVLAEPERRRRRTAVLPEVRHLTRKERVAIGKDARGIFRAPVTRSCTWAPTARIRSRSCRVRPARGFPELVPIRYGRMLESEFAFFRGAALVMASDLSRTPVTGIHAQLCGDAHLSNFGLFASPERRVVFDLNDFDETAARSVGVGPQAPGRQFRDRRP